MSVIKPSALRRNAYAIGLFPLLIFPGKFLKGIVMGSVLRFSILECAVAFLCSSACVAGAQSYSANFRYPNPDGDMNAIRARGPCQDPWVTLALEVVHGAGRFTPDRCEITLYNNGHWDSFNSLVHAVSNARNVVLIDLRLILAQPAGNGAWNLMSKNGVSIGTKVNTSIQVRGNSKLVGNDGSSLVIRDGTPVQLITDGGSTMVAAGGGNMVAAGGGNMVAAGGGNMVAAGGGNISQLISNALSANPQTAISDNRKYVIKSVGRLSDLR